MSSPFTLFRRYERTLMVVITGLSMISFVLLGAVQDPRNVPTPLIILFLAAMAGGIAWLAGLNRGKGSEWGVTGALTGAIIGLGIAFYAREASAVLIDNGNLSSQEVSDLRRQRYLANRFVRLAFQETFGVGLESLPPQMQRNYQFGFAPGDDVSVQDVVLGELLRREADRMGIVVSKKIVTDYIKRVTSKTGLINSFERVRGQMDPQSAAMYGFYLPQMKEKPLTAQTFTKIREQLQVSETELLAAIEAELKSGQAYQLLSGNNYFPPEQFWEFYRQLNVRQTAEVASVPVSDFIDLDVEPTESELNELFNQYRENTPGYSVDGRPEPGHPGFVQPRRIQLGYLEAVFDQLQPLVGEVTEEEIQKAYEDKYLKKSVPEGEMPASETSPVDGPDLPPAPTTESSEKPETETKPAEEPSAPEKPATIEKSDSETDKPTEETPAAEPDTSAIMSSRKTQLVAFFQDEEASAGEKPAAEPASESPLEAPAPAENTPAEKPETEKPASETDKPDAPVEAKSGEEKKPGTDVIPPAPTSDVPAAPTSEVPELNDALKLELKEEILRDRTRDLIQKRIEAAQGYLAGISDRVRFEKDDPKYLSQEAATEELNSYAGRNNLVYVVTPPISYVEMADSEDYPIGQAFIGQRMTVADAMFRSAPTDLYRAGAASDFNSLNAYAFWKLADKAAFVPQSLDDDPGIRAEVIKAWNLEQARPKAQARAEALAKQVRESDKPMGEALSEETVTGTTDSLFIPVRMTGEFTWMQKPIVPPTGMQQQQSVRPSVIPGVTDAGEQFFQTVFDELSVDEVGVAPNNDHTALYVVKILSRDPSTPEELEAMRKKFLANGMQGSYSSLLQQTLSENSINWLQQLFEDHDVVIMQPE